MGISPKLEGSCYFPFARFIIDLLIYLLTLIEVLQTRKGKGLIFIVHETCLSGNIFFNNASKPPVIDKYCHPIYK